MIYPKNCSNQRCDYWLHQTNKDFVLKLILINSGQLQNSGKLQNNTVNGAMSITINRVIKTDIVQIGFHLLLKNLKLSS